jgi:exopolyphosphatase/guanosine-5'-triphosphate,3'-diphosphate pyrophosphatase
VAANEARGTPPPELRNLHISAEADPRLRKTVVELDLEQRLGDAGLDPRRADLNRRGTVLLDVISAVFGAEERRSATWRARRARARLHPSQTAGKSRKSTTSPTSDGAARWSLPSGAPTYAEHANQVVRLALALFDQTRAVHGLTDREREWLEYASLMHDIGGHISFAGHHKHSYYLIKNGDLRGFHPDEIEVMALVARYHRRGTPRRSHRDYAQLPSPLRRTVKTLASILRVAESLDRSHAQPISGLEVHDRGDDIVISLHASGDAELEVWATGRHLEPFEELVGKAVRLEMAEAVNPEFTSRKRVRNSGPIRSSHGTVSEPLHRVRTGGSAADRVRRRHDAARYR